MPNENGGGMARIGLGIDRGETPWYDGWQDETWIGSMLTRKWEISDEDKFARVRCGDVAVIGLAVTVQAAEPGRET